MAIEFCNRVGKRYFLKEGKTKTGKPRYFFSSNQNGKGEAVNSIPEGYEIYEHPENAQVFLRKIQPRLITDLEEQYVKKLLGSLNNTKRYIVDCKSRTLTIYESSVDSESLKGIFGGLLDDHLISSGICADNMMSDLTKIADQHYTATLRFNLVDKEKRKFTAERFCFRGSIDDWIYLSGPDYFTDIVKKHASTLGKDEFFERY
jgi:hypothetical protein